jgi:anti-sigma B factor antagonist
VTDVQSAELAIRVDRNNSHSSIELRGALELASVEAFEDAVRDALDVETRALTLDLSTLDFIDSTGIRVLLGCNGRCASRGVELTVRRGNGQVARVLELTGVDGMIPYVD